MYEVHHLFPDVDNSGQPGGGVLLEGDLPTLRAAVEAADAWRRAARRRHGPGEAAVVEAATGRPVHPGELDAPMSVVNEALLELAEEMRG